MCTTPLREKMRRVCKGGRTGGDGNTFSPYLGANNDHKTRRHVLERRGQRTGKKERKTKTHRCKKSTAVPTHGERKAKRSARRRKGGSNPVLPEKQERGFKKCAERKPRRESAGGRGGDDFSANSGRSGGNNAHSPP